MSKICQHIIYIYIWRVKSRPQPYPNPFFTSRKSSSGTRYDNRNWMARHHQSRRHVMLYCDTQPAMQTSHNTTRATHITRTIPITIPTISTISSLDVSDDHFSWGQGDPSTDSRSVPTQDSPWNCVLPGHPSLTITLNSWLSGYCIPDGQIMALRKWV